MKIITFSFTCLLLISCEASFGDKYTIDNFEIYYTQEVNKKYVEKTGEYFRDHGLIQKQKHSVQLSYDPKNALFKLKLILNSNYDKLPSEMIDDLLLLEDDMQSVIFDDLNFQLEVCDEHFNPIKS